jgi:hypothetical protein
MVRYLVVLVSKELYLSRVVVVVVVVVVIVVVHYYYFVDMLPT